MSDAMINDPRFMSQAQKEEYQKNATSGMTPEFYNSLNNWASNNKLYDTELQKIRNTFNTQRTMLNEQKAAAQGDPDKMRQLQQSTAALEAAEKEAIANLQQKYNISPKEATKNEVEKRIEERMKPSSNKQDTRGNSTQKTTTKDNSGKNYNSPTAGMFNSLAEYFASKNTIAPGSENLNNQAKMHDTQAAQEEANAQQNQQIANRNYRVEAEKNAVANAATENAQTVANLGNASAGAAALERKVGTADYNTHMNRQDEQREKAVEKQREAWGARQTAEEERQAAEAENYDKSQHDLYNSLARYLSMGAGDNNTDTSNTQNNQNASGAPSATTTPPTASPPTENKDPTASKAEGPVINGNGSDEQEDNKEHSVTGYPLPGIPQNPNGSTQQPDSSGSDNSNNTNNTPVSTPTPIPVMTTDNDEEGEDENKNNNSKPQTAPEVKPNTEPATQPAVQPNPEPATQPAVQPSPETQPAVQPAPQPATQPVVPEEEPEEKPEEVPNYNPFAEPEEVPMAAAESVTPENSNNLSFGGGKLENSTFLQQMDKHQIFNANEVEGRNFTNDEENKFNLWFLNPKTNYDLKLSDGSWGATAKYLMQHGYTEGQLEKLITDKSSGTSPGAFLEHMGDFTQDEKLKDIISRLQSLSKEMQDFQNFEQTGEATTEVNNAIKQHGGEMNTKLFYETMFNRLKQDLVGAWKDSLGFNLGDYIDLNEGTWELTKMIAAGAGLGLEAAAGSMTGSDERQKNILAGCFSRF